MDAKTFDIPRYLSVLPLFMEMNPPELERLASGCHLRRLARGDSVFRQGEACNEFHVVVTGQVKLFALSPQGSEKVIELVGPGQSFAEALMFTGQRYIINAQALTPTLLLGVGKAAVEHEIARDPRFAMRMLAGISRRLHGLVRDVQSYALHSGLQRVIGYLLSAPRPGAPQRGDVDDVEAIPASFTVELPVSKATVASRLSLTPEYLSRVLHELSEAGLLVVDKREIRILDGRRLAAYAMP